MFIIFLLIVIIVLLIEMYSTDNALNGIEYTQRTSIKVVEPDEQFEVISVLQNKTRRFVSYIRLYEKYSNDIIFYINNKSIKKPINGVLSLQSSYYLMPKQKIERRIKASIKERGRYFLYGATICGGDFLGLTEKTGDYSCLEEIVVIPKETNMPNINIKLSGFLGDMSVNRFILEDPVLTVGFNDYTGQEPQKMISWTQSARVNKLMVKKYDYTLELLVTVILNVEYNENNNKELVEECFRICRTVCQFLESKNIKYRFITNATIAGASPTWRNMNDGWGEHYLMGILEGLGRAIYMIAEPFEKIINKALDYAEEGRGHILITPYMDKDYIYKIEQLRELTRVDVCILTPN